MCIWNLRKKTKENCYEGPIGATLSRWSSLWGGDAREPADLFNLYDKSLLPWGLAGRFPALAHSRRRGQNGGETTAALLEPQPESTDSSCPTPVSGGSLLPTGHLTQTPSAAHKRTTKRTHRLVVRASEVLLLLQSEEASCLLLGAQSIAHAVSAVVAALRLRLRLCPHDRLVNTAT